MNQKPRWMIDAINNLVESALNEVRTSREPVELERKVFCAAAHYGLAFYMEKERFMERLQEAGRGLPFKSYKEKALKRLEVLLREHVK